ncbi:hypothetical protein [Helicobacter sp. MIT 05-5294]|uniref:hypothetical protein n=1 Tax=Helicobacter sp. MIT 05-5294 TaxID=1548150 RepID=UPI00051F9AE9|nr:hypothetical protein [Helicobacter sp. MIT 05-5294]TLD86562.1 hypothetical protein LS69_006060 [Helicobacter sp. MIT 05-5294]
MQINANSYKQDIFLSPQNKQAQENQASFDALLSSQSNSINESQEMQKANLVSFDTMLNELGVAWDSKEGHMLRTAQIVSAIQEYAKENNTNPLSVNWQVANANWHSRFESSLQQKEMLNNILDVLESKTSIQKGYHKGEAESQAHFEERKSKAIDILSAILQDIKA